MSSLKELSSRTLWLKQMGDDDLAHEDADAKNAAIVESMRATNKAREEKEVEVKHSKSVHEVLALLQGATDTALGQEATAEGNADAASGQEQEEDAVLVDTDGDEDEGDDQSRLRAYFGPGGGRQVPEPSPQPLLSLRQILRPSLLPVGALQSLLRGRPWARRAQRWSRERRP